MKPNVFPFDKAREECPQAEGCKYAQIPACTLASIYERCSIYKQKALEATETAPVQTSHFASVLDKFKGVGG